jgi:uncharacterized membrane protein YgdD (TMEM256/DUF423 family)
MAMRAASRLWLGLAGLSGAAGVALSAAAAHATLRDAGLVATSGEFLLLHAPALIAAGWLADRRGGIAPSLAGLAFSIGVLCFCGTLALRGMGISTPDGIAPAGGIALILGWVALTGSAILRNPG